MNPLQSRLGALRRRLRVVVTVRGVCFAAATVLTGLFLAGLFDALLFRMLGVESWPLLRAAFLAGTLTALGIVAYLFLFRPLHTRTNDLSLALHSRRTVPGFQRRPRQHGPVPGSR